MGSWSVYCSISRITINSGTKCVFLPLIKNNGGSSEYDSHIPATLPIFGEYNDYGGIENIVRDENVELIEKMYKCTIEEFCDFLTDGRKDYKDEYSDWYGKEHLKPLEKFTYMWVHGQVWEFMTKYHPNAYGRSGNFDMGNPDLLKVLGFEYIGKSKDERYTDHYRYTKGETLVNIVTDGTWMHLLNDENYIIYDLKDLKKLGVDTTEFDGKEEVELHRIFSYEDKIGKLGWVMGIPRTYCSERKQKKILMEHGLIPDDTGADQSLDIILAAIVKEKTKQVESMRERFNKHSESLEMNDKRKAAFESYYDDMEVDAYPKDIFARMIENNEFVCDSLAKMVVMKLNMYCASTSWEPYVMYTTPQCGEYQAHQGMLEAFARINKEMMAEMGYDDDTEEKE